MICRMLPRWRTVAVLRPAAVGCFGAGDLRQAHTSRPISRQSEATRALIMRMGRARSAPATARRGDERRRRHWQAASGNGSNGHTRKEHTHRGSRGGDGQRRAQSPRLRTPTCTNSWRGPK